MNPGAIVPLLSTGGIALTAAVADLLTPDTGIGNVVWEITSQVFVNNDTAARTIFIYRIPPGGAAGQATILLPEGLSIPALTAWAWNKLVVVPQGWKIQGKADVTNKVTWVPDGVKKA